MNTIIFVYPGQEDLYQKLAQKLSLLQGHVTFRHFPDGESYVRLLSDVKDKQVILLCSLNQPDPKIMPILFFAKTAKNLGAKSVGLLSPYLAYMRQDKQFNPGESFSSKSFGSLISDYFDWMMTADPHLHRHHNLNEIYSIPAYVLHVAKSVAEWITHHIEQPLIIGPDIESKQWAREIAKGAGAPYIVLEKIRKSDRDVEISLPQVESYRNCIPVLVDDIISTAHTMIETVKHLQILKMHKPICIGIHGVFADHAYDDLLNTHVEQIVTSNTIPHPSNDIDISPVICDAVLDKLCIEQ